MSYLDDFDFKNPNYSIIFAKRIEMLNKIKNNEIDVNVLRHYYKTHIADFICDWGCTVDFSSANDERPATIPFILFKKQKDWVELLIKKWKNQENLLVEKTRQMGMSWLSVATACAICLFYDDVKIGFGSRKEEYVDKRGDSKSLFEKARMFLNLMPQCFLNGYTEKDSKHMQIRLGTSAIIGESGESIGRGDTTSIYFVDESAFLEQPQKAEASLSQGTRCRVDISTPNGTANPFYEKRQSGRVEVFTFHWRDDPRKSQKWYDEQVAKLDPVTVAQELDINYSASVEGVVIPSYWVQCAIDAHTKLGIDVAGLKYCALDVADEGRDLNAFAGRKGILLEHLSQWAGKDSDLLATSTTAESLCDEYNYDMMIYDADGMGAGIKGFMRGINERRNAHQQIQITPFHGGASVINPNRMITEKWNNKDYFMNYKAQSWWALRLRFEKTYQAIVNSAKIDPDEIISISSELPFLDKLMNELSQPTYSRNSAGKMLIDKKPDGTKSPNLADAVMMSFSPRNELVIF
jgi:hypothetical protein